MDGLDEKLNSILNNPQMMQQIMALAQSMNTAAPPKETTDTPPQAGNRQTPINISMLTRLGNLAQQGNIDQEQRSLLKALSPYLSRNKLAKLERAMQAAKIAKLASGFLNSGGLQTILGR